MQHFSLHSNQNLFWSLDWATFTTILFLTIYHFPFLWFCSYQLFVLIKNTYLSLKNGRRITKQFWSSTLLFIWQGIYSVLRRNLIHKRTHSWYFFPDAEHSNEEVQKQELQAFVCEISLTLSVLSACVSSLLVFCLLSQAE